MRDFDVIEYVKFKSIEQKIKKANSIIVTTHSDPDGDAIGSLIAITLYLTKIGIQDIYVYSGSEPSRDYAFLESFNLITTKPPSKKYDLVIGLDYGARERLNLEEYFSLHPTPLLALDHHPAGAQKNDLGIIDDSYSSTADLIFNYFRLVSFHFMEDSRIVKALMVGALTDTTFCKFLEAKDYRALLRIAELMRAGVGIAEIDAELNGNKTLQGVWVSGLLLSEKRLQFHKTGKFYYTYAYFKELDGINPNDYKGIVNQINNIRDGKFALMLIEQKDGLWLGNLRSRHNQDVNVGKIAKRIGGGGHKHSAAFAIAGSLEEILKQVENASLAI